MKKTNPYDGPQKVSRRKTMHHIMAFVLSLLLFVGAFSVSLLFGFLNNNNLRKALETESYYSGVRSSMVEKCENYAIPCKLDKGIFDSVFDDATLSKDIKVFTESSISGKNAEFDTSALREKIYNAVCNNLKKNGADVSHYKADIDNFCDGIIRTYKTCIKIPYSEYYGKIRTKAMPLASYAVAVAFILVVAFGIIMMAMYHFKVVHKTLRMLSYSFTASGLMLGATALYPQLSHIQYAVQLKPKYIYAAFQLYVKGGFRVFNVSAILLVVLGIAFAVASELLRGHAKHNYYERLEARFRENLNDEIDNKDFDIDFRPSQSARVENHIYESTQSDIPPSPQNVETEADSQSSTEQSETKIIRETEVSSEFTPTADNEFETVTPVKVKITRRNKSDEQNKYSSAEQSADGEAKNGEKNK